ncbi:GapS1 family protein [Pantoea agglomerans]|uniref:GapS1 family protein n=1 Tax=Enterobacter agglomerans TaxID=549 RepID=UPI001FC86053|nr:hypothetical protein [Pantoea agglomerans]
MKLNFPLQIKTVKNYSGKVTAIKKKLNGYTDDSFLFNMYNHFQTIRNPSNGIVSNFPWCCFLALKWKLTEPNKLESREMKYNDFVNVVNRVYDLQNEVSGLYDNNKILLSIRRMVVNQKLYQTPLKIELNTLARQYYWYTNFGGGYFERNFKSLYGLTLDEYYKISAYFALLSGVQDKKESAHISINVYLVHLIPYFGAKTLKRYLDLVSIKPRDFRLFMEEYKDEKQKEIEYFLDTPMLRKPFIHTNEGLIILSKHILRASLTATVPFLFKMELASAYKEKFGKAMELYVGALLDEVFEIVTKESETLKLYRKNDMPDNTKVVDFIVHENESFVYIDSKAIEPDKTVKYSNDAIAIKQRLGNSFIKGVLQGQDCASAMNKINKRDDKGNDSLIIITHMDHYISTGQTIEDMLDKSFFEMVKAKYQGLPISKDRIYYMTIDEFELLVEVCKVKKTTITSIIDACCKSDSSSNTQKFNVMMHLHNISPEGIPDREIIMAVREKLFDELLDLLGDSKGYWNGKVKEYLRIKRYILS